MYNYLKDHALKNVWCSPDQDNQAIIAPARLTAQGGVLRRFRVMGRQIDMPDNTSHWHIYKMTDPHPHVIGLLAKQGLNEWISFSTAINAKKLVCDIYVSSGIELPRFNSFYMFNQDKVLIVAIRKNPTIQFDFDNDQVFIRLYTNAYFNSLRADSVENIIVTQGVVATNVEEIINLQTRYNSYRSKPGQVYAFVNGFKVNDIDLGNMGIGDVGEFVYDSSIERVIDFRIEDLRTFESTLDVKRKYLLHYAGTDPGTINYRDDIDVFILDGLTNGQHRGVLFHKNQNDAFRMVTHRDYSITTPYVVGYVAPLQIKSGPNRNVDLRNLYVRLHIRKSGYLRPLIFENNRIHDLYKMSDDNVRRALLGVDSVVNNWRAEVLEASNYVKVMDSECCDITDAMVQDAYGYNSISKVIGDTPQVPYAFSQRFVIDVPYGLQNSCTAYEYDVNGHLLGWYPHIAGSTYACINNSAKLVELISGLGSKLLSDKYATDNIAVDVQQSYRVYYNNAETFGVPGDWLDVTGTAKYIIDNGFLKRADGLTIGTFLVRTETRFLAYDLELLMSDGSLRFNITHTRTIGNVPTLSRLDVPMGKIDIILNNKSLIRDLDYFVRFPEVTIVNKEYLDDPLNKTQKIHVRHYGYCDTTLKLEKPRDVGFIEHGLLSNNSKFDIRDDKVLRIIVDGALYDRKELLFSEFNPTVSILNPRNGQPYCIDDIVVPLKSLTNEPTFVVRAKSELIDRVVADYLTLKIPEPPRPVVSAITERYSIFSPFICKLIYDLESGVFNKALISGNYSDSAIEIFCSDYLYLLKSDPTQQEQAVDSNFVLIHPHNLLTVIDLDLISYRFIERVVKLYTNDLVTLSPFLRLKTF